MSITTEDMAGITERVNAGTSTVTATATWRKTKSGEWVAYGRAADLKIGANVTIAKKSGETTVRRIASLGKVFVADHHKMVYGYLEDTYTGEAEGSTWPTSASRTTRRSRYCDECGNLATPGTVCWETGHTH